LEEVVGQEIDFVVGEQKLLEIHVSRQQILGEHFEFVLENIRQFSFSKASSKAHVRQIQRNQIGEKLEKIWVQNRQQIVAQVQFPQLVSDIIVATEDLRRETPQLVVGNVQCLQRQELFESFRCNLRDSIVTQVQCLQ
jgi:hypothetical protein